MRKLLFNSAFLSTGLALAQGCTALAYLITARTLGPSDFGEVAAYVGIAMLIVAAGDFGFTAWVVRELARSDSRELFATSLGVRAIVAGGMGAIWTAGTAIVWMAGLGPWYGPILGVWVAASLLWATLLAPLQASERMHEVAAVTAVERVVLLGLVAIGTLTTTPGAFLVAGLAAGGIVSSAVALCLVDPSMRRVRRPKVREIVSALRSSFGFALSSLALQAQRLDVAIVGLTAGSFSAGIYAAPARLTNALGILPTAFSSSLFPRAAKQKGVIWTRELFRSLALLLLVMITITVPLFIFAHTLAAAVLGHQYRSSGNVLRVILVGMLVASINQPIALTYQARGLENFVAKAIAAGSALGLATIAVGARLDGAGGAAFGFIAYQIAVLAVLVVRPPRLSPDTDTDGLAGHAHL